MYIDPVGRKFNISIHAPLAGSDRTIRATRGWRCNFNPRSPCGERQRLRVCPISPTDFNPRSPCGERLAAVTRARAVDDFNPRSPCGERLTRHYGMTRREHISIHAPLAGSDVGIGTLYQTPNYFNPRSPCGERPLPVSDQRGSWNFNPRSPCGERQHL